MWVAARPCWASFPTGEFSPSQFSERWVPTKSVFREVNAHRVSFQGGECLPSQFSGRWVLTESVFREMGAHLPNSSLAHAHATDSDASWVSADSVLVGRISCWFITEWWLVENNGLLNSSQPQCSWTKYCRHHFNKEHDVALLYVLVLVVDMMCKLLQYYRCCFCFTM